MATTVYVTSTERFSGKTALCIGLIHWFQRKGLTAGYMKPISTTARAVGDKIVDEDAAFIRSTLNQIDSLETMAPLLLTEQEIKAMLERMDGKETEERILDAYRSIAKDKAAVIMEGGTSLREGWILNLAPPRLSGLLGAGALVVVPYLNTLQVVDDLLSAQNWLGKAMVGGVINSIPSHHMPLIEEKVRPFIESRGVRVFAAMPKEKVLLSVSIAELVDELNGEVLCCSAAADELVETLMVGAMGVESALSHFRRGANKAVITGGDRPDVQIAALETSTRCLILTGNLRPSPLIIGLAEERGVPIILTRHDTLKAIEIIESFFDKTRFHQQKKVAYFERLLDSHMDFRGLSKALGLAVE
jgi:uncharacterized protein